jgi:hypothetical protein
MELQNSKLGPLYDSTHLSCLEDVRSGDEFHKDASVGDVNLCKTNNRGTAGQAFSSKNAQIQEH